MRTDPLPAVVVVAHPSAQRKDYRHSLNRLEAAAESASSGLWRHAEVPGDGVEVSALAVGCRCRVAFPTKGIVWNID